MLASMVTENIVSVRGVALAAVPEMPYSQNAAVVSVFVVRNVESNHVEEGPGWVRHVLQVVR